MEVHLYPTSNKKNINHVIFKENEPRRPTICDEYFYKIISYAFILSPAGLNKTHL